MSVDQAYHQMRVLLERHKDNERVYRDKIKEVNLTRAKINDQLDILKQTYDKKLKTLEQKLQALKQHNETLSRQNILFKSEIQTYQNRLVQKQKIIALLLSQKREPLIIGSSERSKSDKTDSLNANEDEHKHFKKQVLVPAKDDQDTAKNIKIQEKDHQIIAKTAKQYKQILQQQPELQEMQQKKGQIQSLNVSPSPVKSEKKKAQVAKKSQKVNLQQKDPSKYFQSLRVSNEQVAEIKQVEIARPVRPPPIVHKKHSPKPPPKKINVVHKAYADEEQEVNHQIRNHHENETINSNKLIAETQHIEEIKHIQEDVQVPTQQIKRVHNNYQEINENLQNQDIDIQNQNIQAQPQLQQEYQNYQTSLEVEQDRIIEKPKQEFKGNLNLNPYQNGEGQYSNNFLSHFTNNSEETPQQMAAASMSPKPLAKKKKGAKKVGINSFHSQNFDGDHSINSSDFFNQLGKQDPQPQHHLDIEESSIDHIDRDNSLLSNEQPYFVQEQPHFVEQEPLVKAKPVKMTKKKGKRDQIKVADPSLFL